MYLTIYMLAMRAYLILYVGRNRYTCTWYLTCRHLPAALADLPGTNIATDSKVCGKADGGSTLALLPYHRQHRRKFLFDTSFPGSNIATYTFRHPDANFPSHNGQVKNSCPITIRMPLSGLKPALPILQDLDKYEPSAIQQIAQIGVPTK